MDVPTMPFNPKIDHVLVTDSDAGPEGWELVPVQDLNVFYDPAKMDEADMAKIIEDFENGEGKLMDKVAYFDTALDRELGD
jgi:hypothetical protein